jgi:hypothetical protein
MFPVTAQGMRAGVRRVIPRPVRRVAGRLAAHGVARQVEQQLAALASRGEPIVAGPWLGEVGFELLYWVPFVRWFAARFGVPPERIVAVSRGGSEPWYRGVADRYLDVLQFMSADEFRRRNQTRATEVGEQKQVALAALDEEVLAAVRGEIGGAAVLHPEIMYRLFAPYWWGHQPLSWVRRFAQFQRMAPPEIDLELPPDYIAVKFYFNDCFVRTTATERFVERTIRRLSDEAPVISLSTGLSMDEHGPCEPDVAAMRSIQNRMSPTNNLMVQSAIVAQARRFVGTYGGFAYLAPFYGVPSHGYFSDGGGFSVRHLELARAVFGAEQGMPLLTVEQA